MRERERDESVEVCGERDERREVRGGMWHVLVHVVVVRDSAPSKILDS